MSKERIKKIQNDLESQAQAVTDVADMVKQLNEDLRDSRDKMVDAVEDYVDILYATDREIQKDLKGRQGSNAKKNKLEREITVRHDGRLVKLSEVDPSGAYKQRELTMAEQRKLDVVDEHAKQIEAVLGKYDSTISKLERGLKKFDDGLDDATSELDDIINDAITKGSDEDYAQKIEQLAQAVARDIAMRKKAVREAMQNLQTQERKVSENLKILGRLRRNIRISINGTIRIAGVVDNLKIMALVATPVLIGMGAAPAAVAAAITGGVLGGVSALRKIIVGK